MNTPEHVGRKGPRTKEQRLRELLRRSKSSQSAYSIGGIKKTKGHAPKPVTLARLTSAQQREDGK